MADDVEIKSESWISLIISEIIYSPINLTLLMICVILIYKLWPGKESSSQPSEKPELPPLKKQDMTLEELKKYDGKNEDGRICVAVNGKIFDVTRGKRFYGPGGPYEAFAGHDASRGLALFSIDSIKDEYDDLSDLNTMEMESVREWEMQFTDKYTLIGRLLKPGEEPTDYSEDDEASQDQNQRGMEENTEQVDETKENKKEI
ncbi:membrane-associated progesterone receptor component 1-like [Centruroides vittatus]|uniref:membrane-associated progesterone receptor component 1-like n=1 Tax=Centruroides vittatus TaxID=120091 RepID=UPI003510AD76